MARWHGGVTRTVVLTRRWAIKLPTLVYGWKFFLYGLLANMQEKDWTGSDERLCPVRFAVPGGFLIVMPRCEALMDEEYSVEVESIYPGWAAQCDRDTGEVKSCSFGRLNGRIVAVDYGGCGRGGRTTQWKTLSSCVGHLREFNNGVGKEKVQFELGACGIAQT